MHELGIVYEVIKVVDEVVISNGIKTVDTIILEIGALSQVVPRFIEECFPAAIDGTPYENTKLEIISLPAMVNCESCGELYDVIKHKKKCPKCSDNNYKIVSGQEFNIKEIKAY